MKRTVGIITQYGLGNYGNRLQNYAVKKVLSDMGLNAKTYGTDVYWFDRYGRKVHFKRKIHELTGYRFTKSSWTKCNHEMAFEDFTKKYLPSERVNDLSRLGEKADYFVIGSDQVWNPTWFNDVLKSIYLLTFARPEQKVCFSPSFGISELPDEWKPWFAEHLKTFPKLNVREQAGAEIIKKLTGQDALVTIDPTMMLDAKDWLKIAKKPYKVNTRSPFILTCFLGNRTERAENDIHDILKTREMKVYHLLDLSQPFVYACGPSEFIYLFSKADLVLTDSFHACVFSFLFNKPFVVYDREQEGAPQMNSRLDTLLSMLKLERKYREKNYDINWFECNYTEGWEAVNAERIKLWEYLADSFHPND